MLKSPPHCTILWLTGIHDSKLRSLFHICEAEPTGEGDVDMKPVFSYYLPSLFLIPLTHTSYVEGWLSNGTSSVKRDGKRSMAKGFDLSCDRT